MTQQPKPRFVCTTCNVLVEGASSEPGQKVKPKCDNNHEMTEVMPFWQGFVGGILFVPLSYAVVRIAGWIFPVLGQLIWAFVGLWPLAALIAFIQGIAYSLRSGPTRKLAPQVLGMAFGMTLSFVPIVGYFALTMDR